MEADKESKLERSVKADLLAILTIFAGFKDKELVEELFRRRRELVIESIAYEIFKEEGIKEGKEEGIKEGIKEGELKASKEMLFVALRERFDVISVGLAEKINEIENVTVLKELHRQAMRSESLEAFERTLEKATQR